MMTDEEFKDVEIRSKLLDTFQRLGIYKPEPSWEDSIMRGYYESLKNFGIADTVIINPKAYKDLQKALKSKK